ncbi:MAG TPA: hypothetical protein PK280_11005 [Planctomycetota bacterium]|nr:hypothetical protein [Planctomycetota bacterium]
MRLFALVGIVSLLALAPAALGGEEPLTASDLAVKGAIDGENISFTLSFSVEPKRSDRELPLVTGDMVLESLAAPGDLKQVRYDPQTGTYFMKFPKSGPQKVAVTFAARPHLVEGGPWREVIFAIPSSRVRDLEVACDRGDLEVLFPGAMRLDRQVRDDKLTVKAVLGPGRPFAVRWKPQVRELDAALVLASEANTIAVARAGALGLDTLFAFDIAQGKLRELSFSVPPALSVTQVRGPDIRDWRVTDGPPAVGGAPGAKTLSVVLARPQTKQYGLQIQAEAALAEFPAEIDLPVIEPAGCIRSNGHVAVGTDSAIHLLVKKAGGLSQKNAAEFPRIILDQEHPRPLPASNAFFYTYAATPYQMRLGLADIVPAYDAEQRLVVTVRDDDLIVDAELDMDVRDAAIRRLSIEVPAGFLVAAVKGSQVEEHRVIEAKGGGAQQVEIHFREPVLGRALITMRLELGRSPLGASVRVGGLAVAGAKSQRGAVVVAGEKGVQLDAPKPEGLREVHVSSVPMNAPGAQFAYRFRDQGWGLGLLAREKTAGVRAEAFHLVSIGEGVAYGSVVVNYFISGAPVDELWFRIPDGLQNVEFVGGDVLRWLREGGLVKVKLQRKVIGDYNLGLTHSQRYEDGGEILVGGVECAKVETQTGFICVASHLNLKLETRGTPDANLLEIDRSEVPANYRLLVNAPVLKTYKYVNPPHNLKLGLSSHARAQLLPAVVEVMAMNTELAVVKGGGTDSVTRVRYEVKNSSSQFLTLEMPKGAAVWSTSIVERGGRERTRVNSSFDRDTGLLKIPLLRRRNPNDPVTVELEYGQTLGGLGWNGRIELAAPRSAVRSTYAQWTLKAPKDWAVLERPDGAQIMVPEERRERPGRLALVLSNVASSWARGAGEVLGSAVGLVVGLVLVMACGLALALRRRLVPAVLVGSALLAALVIGVAAAGSPEFGGGLAGREDLSSLTFSQALSLDEAAPLAVSAALVPAWRQDVGFALLFVVPALSLAALILALRLRGGDPSRRWLPAGLAALGLTGLLAFSAALPGMPLVLGHFLTWGLPATTAVCWLVRAIGRRTGLSAGRIPAAAGLLLLAGALLAAGCQGGAKVPPKADEIVLERVECTLAAEKDSMVAELRLNIDAPREMAIPLADQSAILLTPEKLSDSMEIKSEAGRYVLRVKRSGRHSAVVKLLMPLAKAGDDGLRQFGMPLPPALVNRVVLTVPEPGMDIASPTAVKLNREETLKETVARVVVGPRDPVSFVWKPRTRQTKLEKTEFYSEVTSLFRFDAGLAEGRHQLRFQIAQGELGVIRLRIPAGSTVTVVDGRDLGAWRFDPAKSELEARLAKPASGEYELTVVTQAASESLPADVNVASIDVVGAVRQRGTIGLAASPAVFLTLGEHPHAMSPADFLREAGAILAKAPGLAGAEVRHAFRSVAPGTAFKVTVSEVKPELRVSEMASFFVGDERLVYDTGAGGGLVLTVAKAGVFSARLVLPEGYDIDALAAPEVSHWDDTVEKGVRTVQIHFKQKLLGSVALKLALSRSVSELPERIALPRVGVVGELKHTGQVAVSAARGIRLSETERKGASSVNPLELGRREPGVLVYNLLKPDWELVLRPEVVEPRVNVDFLHVARVTEGLVRHTHYLRYRLHNAGVKVFDVEVPKEAIGLLVSGSEIANSREISPGRWRVELDKKKFDQPYLLTVRYETRFDRTAGEFKLAAASAAGVDLQRGHIVVFATDRTELAPLAVGDNLQAAEARSISSAFGAGDLSGAAFCYATAVPAYNLAMRARRHEAAPVLEAEVLETAIATVVSERGENINHVRMLLKVGGKRNLETRLPAGARIWSLTVNGRSTAPSEKADAPAAAAGAAPDKAPAAGKVVLIPLPQTPTGELTADVEFVYVASTGRESTAGRQEFLGPRFDLPLKQVSWQFFLPEGCKYGGFGGTLALNEEIMQQGLLQRYNVGRYEQDVQQAKKAQEAKVDFYQDQGKALAESGKQYEARYAYGNALNYSFNDAARNEDARVQLNNLIRGQALVGLVGRRGYLRPAAGQAGEAVQRAQPVEDLGDNFSQADAERLRNSLSKADSENLEWITKSVIEAQEAAAGSGVQIAVSMPLRGRVLEFDRPVQVKPNSEMAVSFEASKTMPSRAKRDWAWGAGLFAAILALVAAWPPIARKWAALASEPKPAEVVAAAVPGADAAPAAGLEGPSGEGPAAG